MFQNVFLDAEPGKTRVLVTHALHFLPQADCIYTMVDGRISERGAYADLMAAGGLFARFVNEFGSKESEAEKRREDEAEAEEDAAPGDEKVEKRKKSQQGAGLMQVEERNTGAVSKEVYSEYLRAGKGYIVVPLLVMSVALLQVSQVMSSYW